jgi:hypothetical protein
VIHANNGLWFGLWKGGNPVNSENLEDIILKEMSQAQEDKYWMIQLHEVWTVHYGKPLRTGRKQGEMWLNCFYLLVKIGTASATNGKAEQLHLLSCLCSEKQECRFLLYTMSRPPGEPLLHPVDHCV